MKKFFSVRTLLRSLMVISLSLLRGLALPVELYLLQKIIDSVVGAHSGGNGNSVVYLLVLFAIYITSIVLNKVELYTRVSFGHYIERYHERDILLHCSRIEYEHYEQEEALALIERVVTEFKMNMEDCIDVLATVLKVSVSVIGVVYFVYSINWKLSVLLLSISIPVWSLSIHASVKESKSYISLYKHFMKARYLSKILNSREYVKESRVNRTFKYINSKWKENLGDFHNGQVQSNIKTRYVAGGFIFLQYICVAVVMFVMIIPLSNGVIQFGAYIALGEALRKFVGGFQYEIIAVIKKISKSKRFFSDVKSFMSFKTYLDSNKVSAMCEEAGSSIVKKIELRNVWYKYPGSTNYILKGVNMTLNQNETVALVGRNGSGKSTLLKIILGLLKPEVGAVLINDVNLRNLTTDDRIKFFATIFQDFAKYELTLQECVALSNISELEDKELIINVLSRLNSCNPLHLELENGLNTKLGKQIDGGIDLSGGQWQTIAIARALFSRASCIILDEPTAALDPIAEANLYDQLIETTRDRLAIFVTHRLGSTRYTDKIFTLSNGVIVESGSHDQLIEMRGVYAEMYSKQKQWYR